MNDFETVRDSIDASKQCCLVHPGSRRQRKPEDDLGLYSSEYRGKPAHSSLRRHPSAGRLTFREPPLRRLFIMRMATKPALVRLDGAFDFRREANAV